MDQQEQQQDREQQQQQCVGQKQHHQQQQQQQEMLRPPMLFCTEDFNNQRPKSKLPAGQQDVRQRCIGRAKSAQAVSVTESKLISMNPFSRSSKLITLALKSTNATESLVPMDKNYYEKDCEEIDGGNYVSVENESVESHSGENESLESEYNEDGNVQSESEENESNEDESKSNEIEGFGKECERIECVETSVHGGDGHGENVLDISTSQLLPLANLNTSDFNPNTSFSEYTSMKSNILRTGNTMTNNRFPSTYLTPRAEYLDLSTGEINVLDRNSNYAEPFNKGAEITESHVVAESMEINAYQTPRDVETQATHFESRVLSLPEDENQFIESSADEVTIQKEGPLQTGEEMLEVEGENRPSSPPMDLDQVTEQNVNEEDVEARMEAIHREHGTKKKRKSDPKAWERTINKKKRESGKEYVGRKYTSKDEFIQETKPAKSMGDRCGCKASFTNCDEVTDQDRQAIFESVWKLGWAEKKQFVSSMTLKKDVSKKTTKDGEASRRSDTIIYKLRTTNGTRQRVCKMMFLSTTGLTEYFVRTYADVKDKSENTGASQNKRRNESRLSALRFLQTLPVLPSHYCRNDSSKLYIEPTFQTDADVVRLYNEYCNEKGLKPASRNVFMDEFNRNNFSRFKPRKDQCDDCTKYKEGNLPEEEYAIHIRDKNSARAEMEADIKNAENGDGTLKVITMDLQCVLLSPALKVSALYYRTKLCVHNFCIFECVSADVKCYVWHEAEGGLSSNEFASCLYSYLEENKNVKKFIIWSDGCTYQNRNVTMSKALIHLAQKHGKVIEQKILIKGHTQMRVDSVHSVIQRSIGQQPVYCPADYVRIMERARMTPKPYDVQYLDHTFFKNFSSTSNLRSIRPGTKAGDPVVVDIRALRYLPSGEILFKLSFSDDWRSIPNKRGESTQVIEDPSQLHQARIPIAASKYRHLQELKPYMRADFHAFYDALPHE